MDFEFKGLYISSLKKLDAGEFEETIDYSSLARGIGLG